MITEQQNLISKVGLWAALAAFGASLGYDIVQILQVVGVLKYPFDAISIYSFSLGIPVPFVIAMVALHYAAPDNKKIWTHVALLFAGILCNLREFKLRRSTGDGDSGIAGGNPGRGQRSRPDTALTFLGR